MKKFGKKYLETVIDLSNKHSGNPAIPHEK